MCCCEPHFLCLSYHAQTASYNRIMYLPTITSPYLHRVIPTQIWCLSVTKPKFALSHPISAFFFLPSLVVISFNFLERTIDSSTIPYSLPVYIILAEVLEWWNDSLHSEFAIYLLFTLALSYGLHLNVTNSLHLQLLPDFLPLSRIWGQDCNLMWINFMVINQDEDDLYLKLR